MAKVCWPYFDPEYENLSTRINPPRISVDNTSCNDCTLIKVDRMNKPGILLEVVQILTDIDLIITKAFILRWRMVYGQSALCWRSHSIELISRDRPGLLSEITAVLANLHFNVVAAEVWTHNRWIACVYVNDDTTCRAVDDPTRLSVMKEHLKNILRGCEDDDKAAHTSFSLGFTHIDRRLHQMFLADRDCEGGRVANEVDHPFSFKPKITIERCGEKGYSVVSVWCKDRAKLLFDIVCTLTDMQYVVFHATISSDGPYALQVYLSFLKEYDSCSLKLEAKLNNISHFHRRSITSVILDADGKRRVIKRLEAAIQRRECKSIGFVTSQEYVIERGMKICAKEESTRKKKKIACDIISCSLIQLVGKHGNGKLASMVKV
ncbi:hypothetical protein GH714_021898 [Hevea brasiliensis]|uniref:ACT domain-containing protein ACR n=1 Tax=Hevea brasiliensis TaxID=3981 RepID=A0A6A6M4E5_HEVBR|nr:hypothetical protein GH714_021898 [Hevea brasiliensis]